MKTNDEILENITCCTITEEADLDVKENFYYAYKDVIKAMNELRADLKIKDEYIQKLEEVKDSFKRVSNSYYIENSQYVIYKYDLDPLIDKLESELSS